MDRIDYMSFRHMSVADYDSFVRSSWLLWVLFLPFNLLILILMPFIKISGIFAKAVAYVVGVDKILSPATHVPAFYCPSSSREYLLVFTIIPMFGAIFGGLHCLAWNFIFPSEVEMLVWRIASVAISFTPIFPLLFVPLILIVMVLELESFFGLIFLMVGFLQLAFYVLARLTLLVEAIVLLRQQPASAFQAISWSTLIPHF